MAEIASPISGGISAVRNTVSSSVFAGRPTPPTTEPDTITTNLISQNSLTLSTVSQQLSSISENVGRLNFSLSVIKSNLEIADRIEQQREAAKQARDRQLAEQGLREGKESQIEAKIQNALLSPAKRISAKAQGILGRLSNFLFIMVGGWLTNKIVRMLIARSDGNITLFKKIRNDTIKGLLIVGGALIATKLAFGRLVQSVGLLGGNIFRAVASNLILAPVKALVNVLKQGFKRILGRGLTNAATQNVARTAAQQSGNRVTQAVGGNVGSKVLGSAFGTGISYLFDAADERENAFLANIMAGTASLIVDLKLGRAKVNLVRRVLSDILVFSTTRGLLIGEPKSGGSNISGENTNQSTDENISSEVGDGNIMPAMMTPITEEDLIRERELANESNKPQGFMRGLAGFGDFLTGGLTDFDKRGDSTGQRIVKGTADFVTGDAFDFDKKGGLFEGKKKEVNVAKNISSLEEPSPNIITNNQQIGGGDGGGASASPPPRSQGNTLPFILPKNLDNPTVLASKFYGVSLA
tara:strand:+ start:5070 stop:6647 length:1578 start_codon:yes stop_codon:yes gene_type:complete